MPISFKHYLHSIYLHEDNLEQHSFEEWIDSMPYKEISELGEDYLEECHAKIWHLFNLK